MKYSLAFDLGEAYAEQERYVSIPLSRINPDLDTNDNFEKLCGFTMQYQDEFELKKAILMYLPEYKIFQNRSLVILKGKRHLGEIVPYRQMQKYFDLKILGDLIAQNIADKDFREALLAPYSHIKYFAVVSNRLRRAGETELNYDFLMSCIKDFLHKICMEGKDVDYRQLYKMAVLIMSSLGLFYQSPLEDEFSLNDEEPKDDADSPTKFQKEWINRRARLRQFGQW